MDVLGAPVELSVSCGMAQCAFGFNLVLALRLKQHLAVFIFENGQVLGGEPEDGETRGDERCRDADLSPFGNVSYARLRSGMPSGR